MKLTKIGVALLFATAFAGPSALAQSAVNWNTLKLRGEANPRPWCGQWWGYRCNGIAINNKNNRVTTMSCGYNDSLSPAEKLDNAVGRQRSIEYAKLDNWLKCSLNAWAACQNQSGPERSRCLGDAVKGQAYRACAAKAENKINVDTAYEYEIMNKGQGAFGWDNWWGQCNAWGAAAVLYPEPSRAVQPGEQTAALFGGGWRPQTWSVADVKALLTSAHNDIELGADGWFGCRYNGPGTTRTSSSCATVEDAYQDVTPRQLLSAFSKHVGVNRHGVVIDRHTDWEVWNHPLWKYEVKNCKPDAPDAALCGAGSVKKTCEVSFTWAEDGVGHNEVCQPPYGYTERTLAFSVCVKDGNILPDRRNQRWEVPSSIAKSERWPDFIWVPASVGAYAQSGNPYVHKHFEQIVKLAKLAAGDLQPPNPQSAKSYPLTVGAPIPDASRNGLSKTISVSDSFKVKGAALCVDITHPTRGDLVITLKGPNGVSEVLWNRSGGAEDNLKDCHDASHPSFYNKPASGAWTVTVADAVRGGQGKWNSAQLKLLR